MMIIILSLSSKFEQILCTYGPHVAQVQVNHFVCSEEEIFLESHILQMAE